MFAFGAREIFGPRLRSALTLVAPVVRERLSSFAHMKQMIDRVMNELLKFAAIALGLFVSAVLVALIVFHLVFPTIYLKRLPIAHSKLKIQRKIYYTTILPIEMK